MENILKQIIIKKKKNIVHYKNKFSQSKIFENIKDIKNYIDFKKKLNIRTSQKQISIIGEIKKSSPSAGNIVKNFDHLNLAKIYFENNIPFLSVLTEEDFFFGKLDFIKDIKNKFNIPILSKDFFIDTYQVALAKSFGADCILIILSAVDKELAKDLYQAANDLNISTIVEVHSEAEADAALYFENSIIGINNRNLKNLEISLNTTIQLSKILVSHKNPLICESGLSSSADIKFVIEKAQIYNFLIGESLLKSNNIPLKIKEFTQINP